MIGRETARYSASFRTDVSCVREMPNKDPEKARQLKHEWYMRNRETLLQRKRNQRAYRKKLNPPPPKPPKPPPTSDQVAKSRECNRLACLRYRRKNLDRIRALNRDYYHKHRDQIVQQQRDRRARDRETKESPFQKLRALADVCTSRLLEIEHGYTRIEPKKAGSRKKQAEPKVISGTPVCEGERDRSRQGVSPSTVP